MLKPILLCIILTVISSVLFAQEESDYFPIVENCIPEPTLPPDDWTYDGTIMMSGYAGVHGMNAEWETPRVLVFNTLSSEGDEPLIGDSLSPDGQWYAVPMGERFTEVSFNQYNFVDGVRVYRVDGSHEFLEFSLSDFDFYIYFAVAWSYLPVHWIDNESFVIGGILIHPFESVGEPATFDTNLASLYPWAYSPDSQLIYDGRGIDGKYLHALYELDEDILSTTPSLDGVSWMRDSAGFLGIVENSDYIATHVSLFDRSGQTIKDIMPVQPRQIGFINRLSPRRNESEWSPDNKKFVMSWQPESYRDPKQIYVIDFETEQVIDTCLDTEVVPVWSPDGKFLAYLESSISNQNIVIIDLEVWHAYIVGKHIGTDSDMLGWRDD